MWQKLKTRDVMDVAVTDKIEGRKDLTSKVSAFISEIVKNGGADPRPLEQMLRAYIDEQKLRASAGGVWIYDGGISPVGTKNP